MRHVNTSAWYRIYKEWGKNRHLLFHPRTFPVIHMMRLYLQMVDFFLRKVNKARPKRKKKNSYRRRYFYVVVSLLFSSRNNRWCVNKPLLFVEYLQYSGEDQLVARIGFLLFYSYFVCLFIFVFSYHNFCTCEFEEKRERCITFILRTSLIFNNVEKLYSIIF